MKPNQEQIQVEIEKLQEMKPKVHQHTAFCDDNHAAIDAQIDVLKNNLGVDTIYDVYDDCDHEVENAMYAREWLDGNESEPPSGPDGWGSLV